MKQRYQDLFTVVIRRTCGSKASVTQYAYDEADAIKKTLAPGESVIRAARMYKALPGPDEYPIAI